MKEWYHRFFKKVDSFLDWLLIEDKGIRPDNVKDDENDTKSMGMSGLISETSRACNDFKGKRLDK